MLFPEGERSIDGDVKKFRKGAAILSAHLNAPIVPIAVDGLFDLWPRGRQSNWAGLLPWRAEAEAADALARVGREYSRHCEAARRIAREYFEASVLLPPILEVAGVQ